MKKIALVTGASNGIGKEISLALAEEGYNLVISARVEKNLVDFREEIQSIHPEISILALPTDLSRKEDLIQMAHKVLEEWGIIEVLVNNVGQYETGSMMDEDDHIMEKMFDVNFYSAYHLSKIFGKGMKERKKGHIINIVSIAGKEPVAGAGAYSVSKYALMGLSQNLRLELKPFNIGVTAILPGSTLTRSWEGQKVDPHSLISPRDIALIVQTIIRLSPGANMDTIEIRPR